MSTRRRSRVRIAARNERGPERAGVEAVSAAPSVEAAWRSHRPYLVNLAYQMLGDVGGAGGRPVGPCRQLARRAGAKFPRASLRLADVSDSQHQVVTDRFITACANGDLQALTAVLDPTVWGVGTVLGDFAPPPQINHG